LLKLLSDKEIILIEDGYQIGRSGRDPNIERLGRSSAVVRKTDQTNGDRCTERNRSDELCSLVRRAIIDDDELFRRQSLSENRGQSFGDEGGAVVRRNNNRDRQHQ